MTINTSSSNMLVGVTQRVDSVPGRSELRDAVDQMLVNWVVQAGFLPVPIPNTLLLPEYSDNSFSDKALGNWLQSVQLAALVLSGGNDIGEYPERDTTEFQLLSWAEMNDVPVLGICRGMQVMAVWAGAKLKPVNGHVCTRHKLQRDISGEVNSYHNFSVAECPTGFSVRATAEDGEIEAIRHTSLPWEGWMWHPEREEFFQSNDTKRVKELFSR